MTDLIKPGHREPLLALLKAHRTSDPLELKMLEDMIRFVEDHPDCFERTLLKGHMTGAAWIVNPERTHALLLHHYKLDKWLQPGGHCDGDPGGRGGDGTCRRSGGDRNFRCGHP